MCPQVGRLPRGRGKERRERTGAEASRQGLPNEACSSHRARRSLTGPFFATRSPPFIYPQARDGQTRWEPDNLNRNNGKGERDLSPGFPSAPALAHTHIQICTHRWRLGQSEVFMEAARPPAPSLQLPRHARRYVINPTFVVTVVKRNTGGLFIQRGVFMKRQNWRGRMRTCALGCSADSASFMLLLYTYILYEMHHVICTVVSEGIDVVIWAQLCVRVFIHQPDRFIY